MLLEVLVDYFGHSVQIIAGGEVSKSPHKSLLKLEVGLCYQRLSATVSIR